MGRGRPRKQAPESITEEFLITKEFRSKDEFSRFILGEAETRNITPFEVLVEYMEEKDIAPTAIVKMLNPTLADNITHYATKNRLLTE
jgi:hypothetical protein